MGVKQSREFSKAIAASVEQGRGLEYLLDDPNFVRDYKASCAKLPVKARKRLLTKCRSRGKRGQQYLQKIQKVREKDICISEDLEPFYESWKQPNGFFNQSPRLQGVSAVPEVYRQLRHTGKHLDDPIRQRLYAVALFDLRNLVDEKVSLKIRPEVKQKIVQVISESPAVKDSLKDVVKWTDLYLKFGERMKEIATRNGGLGALLLIPLWLLTMRQWAKEINGDDFNLGTQHLERLGLQRKAEVSQAHEVARRIHSQILEGFTAGLECSYKDSEQYITAEDEGSVDKDVSRINGNAASLSTSPSDGFQGFHEGREHLSRVGQDGTTRTTDHQQHPLHLTSTFNDEEPSVPSALSSMEILTHAARVVVRESGQRDEGQSLDPTVQDLPDTSSDPFSIHATGKEQLHGIERSETGLTQDGNLDAGSYGLGAQMSNGPEPRTCLERPQATMVPSIDNSTHNEGSNPSFIPGANDIDPRSHMNNQYFPQAFEDYEMYFPTAIDFGDLFAT